MPPLALVDVRRTVRMDEPGFDRLDAYPLHPRRQRPFDLAALGRPIAWRDSRAEGERR